MLKLKIKNMAVMIIFLSLILLIFGCSDSTSNETTETITDNLILTDLYKTDVNSNQGDIINIEDSQTDIVPEEDAFADISEIYDTYQSDSLTEDIINIEDSQTDIVPEEDAFADIFEIYDTYQSDSLTEDIINIEDSQTDIVPEEDAFADISETYDTYQSDSLTEDIINIEDSQTDIVPEEDAFADIFEIYDTYQSDSLTEDIINIEDSQTDIVPEEDAFADIFEIYDTYQSDSLTDVISNIKITQLFEEDTESVFANPGMGWQTFQRSADSDAYLAGLPTTTIYRRFSWQELEPEEGKFNFALFDSWLDKAKNNGQRLAWRLMVTASKPSSSTPLLGYAPLWLIDKGASGWIYYRDSNENKIQDPGELDVWSPDLADPIARSYHDRLVDELSKRYNGHPYVDLVDIGSVGLWGEWHFYAAKIKQFVGNPPTGGQINSDIPMYSEQVRKSIIDLWNQKFNLQPQTMLIGDLVGLSYVANKGLAGWRADCWGDMSWHMPNFYDQQLTRANATEIWENGMVALEPCWNMQYWYDKRWDIDYILNWAENHHASYIQNKSAQIPQDWIEKVRSSLKRIGYRLVLKKIEHFLEARAGTTINILTEWENKGVAPPYLDYYIHIKFERINSSPYYYIVQNTGITIKGWLPGERREDIILDLPSDLPDGEYNIYLSILSPFEEHTHPNLKFVKIASKINPDEDGWYLLSKIIVNK